MNYSSVTINGVNMFETYKAPLAERHSVQPPEPKTFFQDIPGADGSADLSEVTSGRPIYERREITMNFSCEYTESEWATMFSEIQRRFNGKEGKIIFEDDQDYYYIGRMSVAEYERKRKVGGFTITVNAEPYKYELLSSLEPWLWDPFNFVSGIIRSYADLNVNGSYTLTIPGTEKWIIPVFIVTGSLTVTANGTTHQLTAGRNKIYSIAIKEGDNVFTFTGTGTISVDYRGGIL